MDGPFAPPEPTPPDGRWAEVWRVVRRWELLRVVYNVALFLWGSVLCAGLGDRLWEGVPELAALAVLLNACFCAGPALEGWLTWTRRDHPLLTAVLFGYGTFFAGFLLLAAIGPPSSHARVDDDTGAVGPP